MKNIYFLILILILVLSNYGRSQNAKKLKEFSAECDTMSYMSVYSMINTTRIKNIRELKPKLISQKKVACKKVNIIMSTVNYSDDFDLTYSSNIEYDPFNICKDRGFISLNHKNIIIDKLYFGKILKDYTFRCPDGFRAFQFINNEINYLMLFGSNSSGMFSGTFLMIFSSDSKSKITKLIYSNEQLAEEPCCLGTDSLGKNIYFYEWALSNGSYDRKFNVYKIKGNHLKRLKSIDLNIVKEVDRYTLIYCK